MNKFHVNKLMIPAIACLLLLSGCTEASKVSHNIKNEADNFNIVRRLSVINTRTDKPLFELVGAFSYSVDEEKGRIEVIVEVEDGTYKKHFVGLGDDVMYVIEDLEGKNVNKYKYSLNFQPEAILPLEITETD